MIPNEEQINDCSTMFKQMESNNEINVDNQRFTVSVASEFVSLIFNYYFLYLFIF